MNSLPSVVEVNFDCLVGPTHHFGGLSFGNLASTSNQTKLSNPKKAALQGLKKMQFLMKRGFIQGVLPPHERPHMRSFNNLGFSGSDEQILRDAYQRLPSIFSSLCSSSSMWAANSATISPASDSLDHKTHISPANLITMFHRSIEHDFAFSVFNLIFADENHFSVHESLLAHDLFSDEGAANHNRLCPSHGDQGLQIFVYGKVSTLASQKTSIYPCRQSRLANEALALRHRLDSSRYLNVAQNPLAIDSGSFHNDVVCVVNENVLLCHQWAFLDQPKILEDIHATYQKLYHQTPFVIEVSNHALPIEDAVTSYLFNSQLLTKNSGTMLLFAPTNCQTNKKAHLVIESLIEDNNPIDEVAYFDVSESMANGGGPACLRLRVPLSKIELSLIKPTVVLSDSLFASLEKIIDKYYVEVLTVEHFFDRSFLNMSKCALAEIAEVLGLGEIYDFQK